MVSISLSVVKGHKKAEILDKQWCNTFFFFFLLPTSCCEQIWIFHVIHITAFSMRLSYTKLNPVLLHHSILFGKHFLGFICIFSCSFLQLKFPSTVKFCFSKWDGWVVIIGLVLLRSSSLCLPFSCCIQCQMTVVKSFDSVPTMRKYELYECVFKKIKVSRRCTWMKLGIFHLLRTLETLSTRLIKQKCSVCLLCFLFVHSKLTKRVPAVLYLIPHC